MCRFAECVETPQCDVSISHFNTFYEIAHSPKGANFKI